MTMLVRGDAGTSRGAEELEAGLFIEILWDIEEVREEGRRRGEKVVTSTWWRAEVLKVEHVHGKKKVTLRYDGRDGFAAQDGEVWMFARHVRLVGDDSTQLRWRYYECSGDVSYEMEVDDMPVCEHAEGGPSDLSSKRLQIVEEKLGTVLHQYEALERLVVSQNLMFSRLVGSGSKDDRISASLFASLRQKMALLMQKPIPPVKTGKECDDGSTFYENSCAGCFSVDVDCDLERFKAIACGLKSRFRKAHFRPSFTEIQFPPPGLEESEVVFAFCDISSAVGVTSHSDAMRMAFRERGICKEKRSSGLDVAIRIVGTCFLDSDNEKSPTAFLVCQSVHEGSLMNTVDSFVRDTRDYDFKSRSYRHDLQLRTSTGLELLRGVFASKLMQKPASQQEDMIKSISPELRTFTLRWRPLMSPSPRTWTRSLVISEFVSGILEMEIPFVVFRGPESVKEMQEFVTESFIRRQLAKPSNGDDSTFNCRASD